MIIYVENKTKFILCNYIYIYIYIYIYGELHCVKV